jgi:23S rRNA (cytidine1920-2'-O)/16S rRNA (cytidine1409-2'-O)-methyltransferase
VRDPAVHREVIKNVIEYGRDNGLIAKGVTDSPINGTKGNREFFIYFTKEGYAIEDEQINLVIKGIHSTDVY